jgi:hypothetical protein
VHPRQAREWIAEFEAVHRHIPEGPPRVDRSEMELPQVPAASIPGLARVAEIIDRLKNALGWLSAAGPHTGQDARDPDALFDTAELHRSVGNLFDHPQAHIMLIEAALGVVARGTSRSRRPCATAVGGEANLRLPR